jgi:hypothetical protein
VVVGSLLWQFLSTVSETADSSVSSIPPTAVATTVVPQARASVIVRPHISARAACIQTDVGRLVVMGHSDGISLIRDESHFGLTDPLR